MRTDAAIGKDMSRLSRAIAANLEDAHFQMNKEDPEDLFTHVAFIDLPEGSDIWLGSMEPDQLNSFWLEVLIDSSHQAIRPEAIKTVFTAFDTMHTLKGIWESGARS